MNLSQIIQMKSSFLFYPRYAAFLLGIQTFFRALFMIIYHGHAREVGFSDQMMAMVHGLKLDLSLTGYLLLLPTLLLLFASLIKKIPVRCILDIYTFTILLLLVSLFFTNMVIYKFWNFPIDRSIFAYMDTPGDMFASIPPLRLILIFGMIILVFYLLFFIIYRRWISKPFKVEPAVHWMEAVFFFLCIPLLFIPIRGGLQTAPINTGSVYFHQEAYVNHAAVNPVWNLVYTLLEGEKISQTANYMPDAEAREIIQAMQNHDQRHLRVLNNSSPNIIIILLESFSLPMLDELNADKDATPNFDALVREGIYFDRMYASGTMTDRAMGSVLGGYPGIPGTCVIYYEQKTEKIPNLNKKLKSQGYGSAFLYGGDIDFAHIRSFLLTGGFEKIISDNDFGPSVPRSNWGVPDHLMFERLLEETDQASSPFLLMLLTLSSHTPFDVPMETVFPGNDYLMKYINSIYYTDQALGDFIRTAKTKHWWDETLIILLADHGCRVGNLVEHEERRFRIPMLWLGGALAVRDTVIHNFGSQTDLPFTLLGQLDIPREDFIFSNDILSRDPKSFAYYTFHDGIGFINDSSYTVYSLTTESYIIQEGINPGRNLKKGLAYLQFLLGDFNKL
jgi:phosphoglycerol transferase MdoB-like AlkP superfamily enzyme